MEQGASDLWIYEDKYEQKESWIPLCFLLSLIALFLFPDKDVYFFIYLAVLVLFLGLSVYVTAKHLAVSIDRQAGIVTANRQILFLNKRKTFNANNVASVALIERPVAVQEGYIVLYYSLVLKGDKSSFEILCSEDEEIAKKHFRDVKAFLSK